jgi:hypothetical protein
MRVGSYIDTLELENEILRDKVKALEAQLKPYLEAERKREQYLAKRDLIDAELNKMYQKFNKELK